jgi:hypothetical protein
LATIILLLLLPAVAEVSLNGLTVEKGGRGRAGKFDRYNRNNSISSRAMYNGKCLRIMNSL